MYAVIRLERLLRGTEGSIGCLKADFRIPNGWVMPIQKRNKRKDFADKLK